ncbi:MAG TPA: class GN sortase [Marinagarivorans sp.]
MSTIIVSTQTSRRSVFSTKFSTVATVVFLSVSLLGFGSSLWIHTKAQLAQYLIAHAWQKTLAANDAEATIKPWHWADTWPVARLRIPEQGIDLYVLAGAQGNSLAFGPGHISSTQLPTQQGTVAISGHRDTHFNFLQHVSKGTAIELQNSRGQWRTYRVTGLEIKNSSTEPWQIDTSADLLTLITCYPFDAVAPGGPLRYLVTAQPLPLSMH